MAKRTIFFILLILASFVIAIFAAYSSVMGLAAVFSGAKTEIMLLAGGLEFAKIVVVSLLVQFWGSLQKILRTFLITLVVFVMILASGGIYGFLSNAYQKNATTIEQIDKSVELINNKKTLFIQQKQMFETQISSKNNRVDKLTNLREQQENRIDNLISKEKDYQSQSTQKFIQQADKDILQLNTEITTLSISVNSINDSIAKYETKSLEISNSGVSVEVWALKYLAKLTGKSIDAVANWYLLICMFVIDPFAILLLVVANMLIGNLRKKDSNNTNYQTITDAPIAAKSKYRDIHFKNS